MPTANPSAKRGSTVGTCRDPPPPPPPHSDADADPAPGTALADDPAVDSPNTRDLQTPSPAAPAATAADPLAQFQRYLVAYGLTPAHAVRVANDLQLQLHAAPPSSPPPASASSPIASASGNPGRSTASLIQAFTHWTQQLGDHLQPRVEADCIAWVMALYGPDLLNAQPDALVHPTPLLQSLRQHLEAWPHGVLPNLPPTEMHRQLLGNLPSVLRGEFWSGTYRWAMPASLRRRKTIPPPPLPPAPAAPPDSVGPPPASSR